MTGIVLPIALSYSLQGILDATPLQAFAAGAALCSTSLGTTFTVLRSSGLSASRLGIVLTSAAMMDDVVGLVMVQVISALGGDHFSWAIVVRPILVSVAFAIVVPLSCMLVVKPVTLWINVHREANPVTSVNAILQKPQTAFTVHTMILIGLVTSGTYAGTSNLFAAYIAGATTSWWDSEVPHPKLKTAVASSSTAKEDSRHESSVVTRHSLEIQPAVINPSPFHATRSEEQGNRAAPKAPTELVRIKKRGEDTSGAAVYNRYYDAAVANIFRPFFFASIGFSIPITRMFQGPIAWQGIVYAVLMAFAKLICGLWLVRFTLTPATRTAVIRLQSSRKLSWIPHLCGRRDGIQQPGRSAMDSRKEVTSAVQVEPDGSLDPGKPLSLHPSLILASAMCARGEIGFLISGVAESSGVFSRTRKPSEEPSDIFLVVTWAIMLCTIAGPLGVGLSVGRVKKLEKRKNSQQEGAGRDVLGVWGVG